MTKSTPSYNSMKSWIYKFSETSVPVNYTPGFKLKIDGTDFLKKIGVIPVLNSEGATSSETSYFIGNSKLFDNNQNSSTYEKEVGDYSVSIINMKRDDYYYINTTNYLTLDNGLILTWLATSKVKTFTPAELFNGIVTNCITRSNIQGDKKNPYFNREFKISVSPNNGNIFFNVNMI